MWEALLEATKTFITAYGYAGILLLTTVEQFIFPAPADPFIALAAGNGLNMLHLLLLVLIGSLTGASIGYLLGRKLGHPVAVWLFGERRMARVEKYIKKWGFWGVIAVGITPIPFKLVTWGAGIFEMPFKKYLLGVFLGRMPRYILSAYAGKFLLESKLITGENTSAFILGALQGLTEFLPISSSGHLVVMEHFLHVPLPAEQLISFDIFLHGGSLIAILLYFWKEWWQVLKEIGHMIRQFKLDLNSMTIKLALGTLPAIVAALLFEGFISRHLRNLIAVGIFFILVGLIYFFVSWKGKSNIQERVTLKKALWIGLAQSVALIPGVSRAGSTIATGVVLGLKREAAARFSFMLGGIAILAANVYSLLNLGDTALPSLRFILTGTLTAFVVSLAGIHLLLGFLKKYSLRAFGVYLILAGIILLTFFSHSP